MKCKATASTIEKDEVTYIKEEKGEHNHSSDILKNRVKKHEKEAIENAAKNPTVAPPTVLAKMSNTVQNESMAAATSLSTMNSMKMAIYRARRKEQGVVDRLPSSPEELLNLDPKFQNLQSGEKFLVSQERLDEENVIPIFMANESYAPVIHSSWTGLFPQFLHLLDNCTLYLAMVEVLWTKSIHTPLHFYQIRNQTLTTMLSTV